MSNRTDGTSLNPAKCRRHALEEGDPLLLIGPDMLHYAELLIREDHGVLAPGFQFWGNLADYLNRIMHLPERPARQYPGCWPEFNAAVTMAAGYIRDVSPATDEQKRELLARHFRAGSEEST